MKIIILIIEYIFNIVALFLILMILSGRRDARATFSWILTLIFLPVFGVIFYIIIGNPRLKRLINVKLKKSFLIKREKYDYSKLTNNDFCNKVCTITKKHPVSIKSIELFGGASKYARLSQDIIEAKKIILLEYYIIDPDEMGEFFINLLIHKLEEGVKVYILYDGVGSITFHYSNLLKRFKKAGGNAAVFLPLSFKTLSLVNFRNHRKIAIIDGKICYTGGVNIGDDYLGKLAGKDEWIDCHVRLTGNVVSEFEKIFCEDWYYATNNDISNDLILSTENTDTKLYTHVIPSGADQDINYIYESLLSVFISAKKSITIITPYFVPDETIVNILRNISMLGIEVTVIVPGKNNHPIVGAAGRSYYEELVEAGVKIYETKYMLHSKLIIVDRNFVSIGTVNMDNRSMKLNFEVSLLIYSQDFAGHVLNLASEYISISKKIDIDYLRRKPKREKLFEGVCRVFSPLL
ncbi:cardiolipin synthase [Calditerrivibrio nitroreducens]|uniref:Cardiolipin synthase n=1 Tax=Calditerrivibrio nitroreducens (strain DSM 19672 / NBRC 101217 / Yu37-1) TaxID=768670 RepID=E4TJG0_CALNY|nr:cardiolipin synthase [Calditerrivibrio nitroreducens]ADR19227.1 phospholipase D/Transphosphatidylase [Calditerrivibrio nitroreducens DSM 19672]